MNDDIALLSLGSTIVFYCENVLLVEAKTEAQQASIKLKAVWAEKQ